MGTQGCASPGSRGCVSAQKTPSGPALVFTADDWASFVSAVKGEAF
ncbi:DUF397 domain-containing protein [Streptomyces sp. BRA346]